MGIRINQILPGVPPAPWLQGGGEMGALMRSIAWERTPLGPTTSWSQSLRTALGILLAAPSPMYIAWGPELTQFYNDGYRPLLGSTKHPAALGRSARETFAAIWDLIGPTLEGALQGQAVGLDDLVLPLDRHGFVEECHFSYSASPIRDEAGDVGGVLVTAAETTARVLAERRLQTLQDLAAAVATAGEVEAVWQGAAAVLAANPADVPVALLYSCDGQDQGQGPRESARLCGSVPTAGAGAAPVVIGLDERGAGWPLGQVVDAGPVVVDVAVRLGGVTGECWPAAVRQALVSPIARPGREASYGFLVAGVSPRLILDDAYRGFFGRVAEHIAAALSNAHALVLARRQAEQAEQALHEENRVNEALHRIGRLLTTELELDRLVQMITDAATVLCRAEFGAFFYNVTNDRGESYLLYTLSGVPRECFSKFPAPRNTTLFGPTFRGEGVLRIEDVTRDPRYGHNPPYYGMPKGHLPVRSYLAVPVVSRSGEVLGGLFFGHSHAGVFTERDERALIAVAAQGAAAIDNARLFQQARTAQAESLRLFEEARRSRAEAESASRAKDEFLAILGHELRNPLAPIMTALHLMRLRGGDVNEKERTVIERQVTHLTRLVDDLLDVSRITRGKVELKMQRIELGDVVAKSIELASPLLEQRQHLLTVAVPRPGLVVSGDPVRLGQVVSNLLTNAAKYTELGGQITITGAREGGEVVLRVRDTGIGISPEMLPRVFDLFIQEPQALDRSQGGLGLGLTIVRSLVTLHGGTVNARSEGEGHGTEFTIRLPAAPEREASGIVVAARPLVTPRSAESRRILVVDDNEDAVELLAESLELVGHVVRVAYDGPSALRVAATFLPEVALLDIGLPVMDGYELARRFREHAGLEHARLIAVTGYGQDADRQRSQEAGFDAHLVKPVQIADLMSAIRELTRGMSRGA